MNLFSDDKKEELQRINSVLSTTEVARKRLAAELAAERGKTAGLQALIDEGSAEIERLKGKLLKTKQRQKASIERANRFKKQLTKLSVNGASEMSAVQ